jgi:hypothetical protein
MARLLASTRTYRFGALCVDFTRGRFRAASVLSKHLGETLRPKRFGFFPVDRRWFAWSFVIGPIGLRWETKLAREGYRSLFGR